MATIRVTAFKPSGKHYSTQDTELSPYLCNLDPWVLTEYIEENLPEVQSFSGIRGGFRGFYFVVEMIDCSGYRWPDGRDKFLNFHLDRTE